MATTRIALALAALLPVVAAADQPPLNVNVANPPSRPVPVNVRPPGAYYATTSVSCGANCVAIGGQLDPQPVGKVVIDYVSARCFGENTPAISVNGNVAAGPNFSVFTVFFATQAAGTGAWVLGSTAAAVPFDPALDSSSRLTASALLTEPSTGVSCGINVIGHYEL